MAGHSKWNNIKNRKGAQDAAKGKVFGEVAKLIRIAVKEGGSDDPKFNAGLRVALDKARSANMPKEKIQKAIERGMGKSSSGASIQEITYEGFGPGGVAMIVVALTDNVNRTAGDMKFAFSRNNGSMGGPGSAMYMFQRAQDGGYEATMKIDVEDNATKLQLQKLVDAIREIEDVEDVYVATDGIDEDEK
ncbi:MAG: YebC/PmpR family DNA-binding transcriptional regulator [Pseudomonadales bacterium]|nr:YebC/PmpR family DNA-binding transcriptional regulator [Pseudomonadales bacterium]